MKILCITSQEQWVVERIAEEFKTYSSHSVSFNDINAEVLWLLSPWAWNSIPLRILKNKKVETTTMIDPILEKKINSFNRQALHARSLGFIHPTTKKEVFFEATRPKDFDFLLKILRKSSV